MARKIELTTNECNVLLKVTHRAKMDWFDIDDQNRCRDLERNGRVISTRNAVKTIIPILVVSPIPNHKIKSDIKLSGGTFFKNCNILS